MKIDVHFFGIAHDRTDCRKASVDLPDGATVNDLLNAVFIRYHRLAELRSVLRVAVNFEYVSTGVRLSNEDEVAIIPPVSGG